MKKQKKALGIALLSALIMGQTCMTSWATTIPDGYSTPEVEQRESEYNTYVARNPGAFSGTWKERYRLTLKTVEIVDQFVAENIKPEMSDFEKEMTIIKWMSDHITYDMDNFRANTVPKYDRTPIYPLEIGIAVCSGYAETFNVLASASGLNVKDVSGTAINNGDMNGAHEWNQICLDGEWYNLDVTWADNDQYNDVTLSYINATDSTFSEKHEWDKTKTNPCNAEKYGIEAVEKFFKENNWRYSIYPNGSIEEYKRVVEASWEKDFAVFDDDSYTAFYYSSVDQTAREIADYLSNIIENKEETYAYKIFYPESMNNVKIFQSNGSNIGIASQISNKVASLLDNKYKGTAYKNSAKSITDMTRVYEARNGYWMTYSRDNRMSVLSYKKTWKAEN